MIIALSVFTWVKFVCTVRSDNALKYNEEVMGLFDVPSDFYFAQCISADFGMGRGIAVESNHHFNMKNKLVEKYSPYIPTYESNAPGACCILEDRVLNLITKRHYYAKPTLTSMELALWEMRDVCLVNNITKIAMPLIGCGLDRLRWSDVKYLIHNIFDNTDIEILVCKRP